MNPVDALAVTMLAVILASFGVVAMLFFNMHRNASRRDPELDALMEEALATPDAEPPVAPAAQTPPPEAWEREGDWWKGA